MRRDRKKDNFVVVTYVILALVISLCGYFCYFLQFEAESFINSPYNKRYNTLATKVIRGDIVSRDGVVLATTKVQGGSENRVYPEGRTFAHSVGFATNGMGGVEKDYNFSLLRSHSFILSRLGNEIIDEKNIGDTIVLGLDSNLQKVAYNKLGNYKGAVIAMDPDTGDILVNVSKPDFDPNTINTNWDKLSSDSGSSVLINRATQGLYPPGSTFKIITTLEYLREGGKIGDTFDCAGFFEDEGNRIRCYHNTVHGNLDLRGAFAHSCNSTYAKIALGLNKNSFRKLCDAMLFNKSLPTDISHTGKSRMDIDSKSPGALMMQTGIGQGNTLVTPLHMMMIASAIENGGVVVKPHMVNEIVNDTGNRVRKIKKETYGSIIEESEANSLREYMRAVVTDGTASIMANSNYEAYGKTGTAEYTSDKNLAHSWFVGFAEYNNKKIAIAVIMEGAGAGSQYATPLAKEVFDAYFSNP